MTLVAPTLLAAVLSFTPSKAQRGATRLLLEKGGLPGLASQRIAFGTVPARVRARAWLHGSDAEGTERVLTEGLESMEQHLGKVDRVANLYDGFGAMGMLDRTRDPLVAKVQKAEFLKRMGMRPEDLVDGFLDLGESHVDVPGDGLVRFQPRKLFYRVMLPTTGKSTGRVIQLGPGFAESNFTHLEQAKLLADQGNVVVLFDHSWAGYSATSPANPGGIKRGAEVALETAAISALSHRIARGLFGNAGKVELVGTSMDGGAGLAGILALGPKAFRLNLRGNDVLELHGRRVPLAWGGDTARVPGADVATVFGQGAFHGPTPSAGNRFIAGTGEIPWVGTWPQPSLLPLPVVSSNRDVNARVAWHAVLSDIRSQAAAIDSPAGDLLLFRALAMGAPEVYTYREIHARNDTLADHGAAAWFANSVRGGKILTLAGNNHVWSEDRSDVELGDRYVPRNAVLGHVIEQVRQEQGR